AYHKKTMHPFDAMFLGLSNRMLYLFNRLSLAEPVEHLLGPCLNPECEHIAVCLDHNRHLLDGHRIHAAFASPSECELAFNNTGTYIIYAPAVHKKVVIGKIKRAIAGIIQLLHLSKNMLCGTVAPSALRNVGDIAVYALVGTAPGRLYGAEFIEREYRRNVQR